MKILNTILMVFISIIISGCKNSNIANKNPNKSAINEFKGEKLSFKEYSDKIRLTLQDQSASKRALELALKYPIAERVFLLGQHPFCDLAEGSLKNLFSKEESEKDFILFFLGNCLSDFLNIQTDPSIEELGFFTRLSKMKIEAISADPEMLMSLSKLRILTTSFAYLESFKNTSNLNQNDGKIQKLLEKLLEQISAIKSEQNKFDPIASESRHFTELQSECMSAWSIAPAMSITTKIDPEFQSKLDSALNQLYKSTVDGSLQIESTPAIASYCLRASLESSGLFKREAPSEKVGLILKYLLRQSYIKIANKECELYEGMLPWLTVRGVDYSKVLQSCTPPGTYLHNFSIYQTIKKLPLDYVFPEKY